MERIKRRDRETQDDVRREREGGEGEDGDQKTLLSLSLTLCFSVVLLRVALCDTLATALKLAKAVRAMRADNCDGLALKNNTTKMRR